MLLGQTLDGMRVWDIRRAIQAVLSLPDLGNVDLSIEAEGSMAVNVIYASLFESGVSSMELRNPPPSHRTGPDYLNVLRILDIPQAVTMAAERGDVRIVGAESDDWGYTRSVARALHWPEARLTFVAAQP